MKTDRAKRNAQRTTKEFKRKRIRVETEFGAFVLEISGKGLCAVRFPPFSRNAITQSKFVARCASHVAPEEGCLSPLFNEFRSVNLDLSGVTPFQKKVYAALRKVPPGKTVTYGELARRAGYPGAARAVGTAMKKNHLPIAIPCHRVVPSSGGIGAYSAGKKWKKILLEQEGYQVTKTPRHNDTKTPGRYSVTL